MPKKFTEIDAKNKLLKLAPHIQLLEWAGNIHSKSKFIDTNRNVEFLYSYNILRQKLKKDPNRIFAATKEEKSTKSKQTFLKNYGVNNPAKNKEIYNKIKQTNLKKYGVDNPTKNKKIREKQIQTCLENHGVKYPQQNKAINQKQKQTNLKKYGSEYTFQSEEIKEKIKQANLKNYGTEYPMQNKDIQEKTKQTNLKKHGVEYPQQNKEINQKQKQTNLKRYGVENPLQNKQIKEKAKQNSIKSKINKNLIITVDGKTLVEWARDKNLGSHTTMLIAHKHNIHPSEVKCGTSVLELKVKQFLDENNINYIHNKMLPEHKGLKEGFKKPDFLLPDYSLIIECDGEHYHQDKEKDTKRNKTYKNLGYKVLCFSGQDILNDWSSVKIQILTNAK